MKNCDDCNALERKLDNALLALQIIREKFDFLCDALTPTWENLQTYGKVYEDHDDGHSARENAVQALLAAVRANGRMTP